MTVPRNPNRAVGVVCLVLALLTAACYWPVTHYGFIAYDDPQYIVENSHVNSGFTWSGIGWALTRSCSANWHPLTWFSHMLDCQLYGLAAPGHHFTSLLLHILNSLLLFFLLKEITGAFWRSALVAALFAWHPLHVESVAWAAERKDVLSTCFFLASILAYLKYVTQSKTQGPEKHLESNEGSALPAPGLPTSCILSSPRLHYILALLFFAFGLMSKPMVVTLPFVLLLIDFWPLQRAELKGVEIRLPALWPQLRKLSPLIWEKIPFIGLTMAASAITFWAQKTGGAVVPIEMLPLRERTANALISYLRYLAKVLWPSQLSLVYPHPVHVPIVLAMGALVTLTGLTCLFALRARRQPYLLVGWLWFLGTLVPVIGLVQVGTQAMADRYMYIPSIGLFVLLVWGLYDLWGHRPRLHVLLRSLVAGSALIACLICASAQIKYWQTDEALFRHAVEVTGGSFGEYDHLGTELLGQGKLEEAALYLGKAAQMEPENAEAHYNLGTAYLRLGRLDEARAEFEHALRLQPTYFQAHNNLGILLSRQGKVPEAAMHFLEETRQNPHDAGAFFNLGVALLELDRSADAASCFRETLRLAPNTPTAYYHLALALGRLHKSDEAAAQAKLAQTLAAASGQDEMAAKAAELVKQFASAR